jgi:hypothetical protein
MILNQIKSILIKDFLIEYSYKGRFIYSILFIFIQLAIFYFLSGFLEASYTKNNDSPISNLFGFFILGVCFLDISYTLISHVSIKIEEYKKIGIFEELFILPVHPINLILMSNIYPVIFSLFKLVIYLACGSVFFGIELNESKNLFILILTISFGIITLLSISLIASSLSILYYRGVYISTIHNTISLLFGGVLYPMSFIYKDLFFLELFIPLHSMLDLARYALGLYEMDYHDLTLNIFLVIIHSIIFTLLGYISIKFAFKKAFREGRISLY